MPDSYAGDLRGPFFLTSTKTGAAGRRTGAHFNMTDAASVTYIAPSAPNDPLHLAALTPSPWGLADSSGYLQSTSPGATQAAELGGRFGAQLNSTQKACLSPPAVAAGVKGYTDFWRMIKVAPFPPLPPKLVQWGALFRALAYFWAVRSSSGEGHRANWDRRPVAHSRCPVGDIRPG